MRSAPSCKHALLQVAAAQLRPGGSSTRSDKSTDYWLRSSLPRCRTQAESSLSSLTRFRPPPSAVRGAECNTKATLVDGVGRMRAGVAAGWGAHRVREADGQTVGQWKSGVPARLSPGHSEADLITKHVPIRNANGQAASLGSCYTAA